jgi:isoquinoline 1-oxidoreductase beta subunit
MRVSRRGLLIGGVAGGGLLVAWALMPRRYDAPQGEPFAAIAARLAAWLDKEGR